MTVDNRISAILGAFIRVKQPSRRVAWAVPALLAGESALDGGRFVLVVPFAEDAGSDDRVGPRVRVFAFFLIGQVDDFEKS